MTHSRAGISRPQDFLYIRVDIVTNQGSDTAQASSLNAEIDEALAWCSYSNGHKTARLLVRLRDRLAESSVRESGSESPAEERERIITALEDAVDRWGDSADHQWVAGMNDALTLIRNLR